MNDKQKYEQLKKDYARLAEQNNSLLLEIKRLNFSNKNKG